MWEFLLSTKQSGVPPTRSVLSKRCHKDNAMLIAVCTIAREVSSSCATTSNAYVLAGAEHIISFVVAVCVESLNQQPSEAQVRTLYEYMTTILSQDRTQHQTQRQMCLAAAMVLTQLSKVARLSAEVSKSLAVVLSEKATSFVHTPEHALLPLIALVQHQKIGILPSAATESLTADVKWFSTGLERASKAHDVALFATAVARGLIHILRKTPEAVTTLKKLMQISVWPYRQVIDIAQRLLEAVVDDHIAGDVAAEVGIVHVNYQSVQKCDRRY
jgi:hypothetical protein